MRRSRTGPVWLDSGHPGSSYGRYDILAAEPDQQLTTFGGQTHIERTGEPALRSNDNPFALIERHSPPPLAPVPGLPFVTGAIGYFGYDLGRSAPGPDQAQSDVGLPDLWLGFYPWAVIQDHREQRCFLVCRPESRAPEIQARLMAGLDKMDLMSFIKSEDLSFNINEFEANIKADSYLKSLGRIQEYIRAGDCYQVNFAQRFSAD